MRRHGEVARVGSCAGCCVARTGTHHALAIVVGHRAFVPAHRELTEEEVVVAGYERRNRLAAPA